MAKKKLDEVFTYSDGGSRGNPGPAAIGIVLLDKNKNKIIEYKKCIGTATNNVAEYKAVIKALELSSLYCKKKVTCFLDSELVVKQLTGEYKVKKQHLKDLFYVVEDKKKLFEEVTFNHVRRSNPYISKADMLVNQALDNLSVLRTK